MLSTLKPGTQKGRDYLFVSEGVCGGRTLRHHSLERGGVPLGLSPFAVETRNRRGGKGGSWWGRDVEGGLGIVGEKRQMRLGFLSEK